MDAYAEYNQGNCRGRGRCGGWSGGRRVLVMGVFDSLRAFFRGGTPGFMPLEKQVLDGVIDKLDSSRAAKLRDRVARIDLVQRLDGGREINVYEIKGGKPIVDDSLRLSDTDGEKVLAEFKLTTAAGVEIGRASCRERV